jgi:hypothetical protein
MKEAKVLQGLTSILDNLVLQRLEGVARSPVFSQLSTSLQGLTASPQFMIFLCCRGWRVMAKSPVFYQLSTSLQGLTSIHDILVLHRLEGLARCPVFSSLYTSLQGLTSIHDILVLQRLEGAARSPVFFQLSISLNVICFVSTSSKFGIATVMGKAVHSRVNVNILASTSVPFRLTMVQEPNLVT